MLTRPKSNENRVKSQPQRNVKRKQKKESEGKHDATHLFSSSSTSMEGSLSARLLPLSIGLR